MDEQLKQCAFVTNNHRKSNVSFQNDSFIGIPFLEAYESKPEAPLSQVHAPEDPEYLAPSDDDIALAEDQPLPASLIALSSGYIVDSEPIEDDFEENLKMDLVDYADEEKDPFEDEDEEEEEEEHLALADSALSVPDSAPLSLRKARKTVRPQPPMAASTEALIAEYASAPTPPSPSPLSPLSSPLLLIPSPPLLLPLPTCMDIIPEVDMLLQKKVRFTNPSHRFETKESSAAATARQTRTALTRGVDYRFIDTLDAKARYACQTWVHSEGRSQAMEAQIRALHAEVRVLQRQRIDDGDRLLVPMIDLSAY
ncbi:hypothetical protein Tco_1381796 [Tanacetum coccineum]